MVFLQLTRKPLDIEPPRRILVNAAEVHSILEGENVEGEVGALSIDGHEIMESFDEVKAMILSEGGRIADYGELLLQKGSKS